VAITKALGTLLIGGERMNVSKIEVSSIKKKIPKLIYTIVIAFIGFLFIMPFIWMISTSFKYGTDVFNYPIEWIPKRIDMSHHIGVWTGKDSLGLYYFNSLKTTLIPMIVAAITCSLAAYGFTKLEFKGRDSFFLLYVSMMMIPPQVLFVPKFIMFDFMGIYNTHWALILPHCFSVFGVFLMRQYFLSIPKELSEAAIVDGASHLRIWASIILPLSKPVLASFCILAFTWSWNDYENPLIFISSQKLYTLPLALSKFVLEDGIDYNGMMAVATAGIIPLIIIFIFAQKYIVESVASSGVKG
jgi:multiple sugar transport system permease protein